MDAEQEPDKREKEEVKTISSFDYDGQQWSVVESVISSAIICWGSSIRARNLKKLNKLIKKAGSVVGTPLEPL
ncbi:hypothetical protein CHARACLAT_023415 [Characodon lateralis]|uniref:Uncharacterized protein n=1 Tax=Characodon lateralis TaxID=208331 RepID=A0ABU7F6G0_9TELE|nr:hypothetical protein [Characodon lateralis]